MKIERRYMAHYLNAGFGGAENYCRLGADLEEYSPELTANVEKKSNILGQTSVTIDGYQKQGEVSPYYAEAGDPLFEKLQEIQYSLWNDSGYLRLCGFIIRKKWKCYISIANCIVLVIPYCHWFFEDR